MYCSNNIILMIFNYSHRNIYNFIDVINHIQIDTYIKKGSQRGNKIKKIAMKK